MSQSVSEQELFDKYVPTILENDAKGILSDLLAQPALALHFMGFTETRTHRAIAHVRGILEECYRAGHLKVMISHEHGMLYGYALLFVHPDPSIARYCHKIFVYEQYRGHGIGSQMLQELLEESHTTCLLCAKDLVEFYEKAGMEFLGSYTAPTAQQGFAFTRDMYRDLVLMGTADASSSCPVFMLNDNDIHDLMVI